MKMTFTFHGVAYGLLEGPEHEGLHLFGDMRAGHDAVVVTLLGGVVHVQRRGATLHPMGLGLPPFDDLRNTKAGNY